MIMTCIPLSEISYCSIGCFGVLIIFTELDADGRTGVTIAHNSFVCEPAAVTADLLDGVGSDGNVPETFPSGNFPVIFQKY